MKKLVLFFIVLFSTNFSLAYEMLRFVDKDSDLVLVSKKVNNETKYDVIDFNTREVILPLEYDSIENFSEGLARVEQEGKWGFIDKNGKVVIPIEYDDVTDFGKGIVRVEKNGKSSLIDTKTGKIID